MSKYKNLSPTNFETRGEYIAARAEAQAYMQKVLDFFTQHPKANQSKLIALAGLSKSQEANFCQLRKKSGPPTMMLAHAKTLWTTVQEHKDELLRQPERKIRAIWSRYGATSKAEYDQIKGQKSAIIQEVVEWLASLDGTDFNQKDFVYSCGIEPTEKTMSYLYQMKSSGKYNRLLLHADKLHAGMMSVKAQNTSKP